MATPAQRVAGQAKRLAVAFAVVFFFCLAAYTARSMVLRSRAREVRTAALEIANTSGLNVELLSSMRTLLRQREVLLDDAVDQSAATAERAQDVQGELGYRALIQEDWGRHLTTRTDPGEREQQPKVSTLLRQADDYADRTRAALDAGDVRGAKRIFLGSVEPTFDELDDALKSLQTINAQATWNLSGKIAATDRQVKRLSVVFDVVCSLLTVGAAVLALLLTRAYSRAVVSQVSELELFSSRVAHDLRGSLGSAKLSVDLAGRDLALSPASRERLARTSRSLQEMADVVDGLLSLAGVMAGVQAREGVRADVKPVLQGVREELLPAAREKGIELGAAEGPDCKVACAPGVLASIARNLVGNAIKHMGESPVRRVSMRVRTEGSGNWARIEVADSGPGIPRSLQPKLFQAFARLAASEAPGLGLGLATVQRIAQRLGGRVGMESREGAGSAFWVELPRTAATGPAG